MDTRQYRYILAIAECGSVSKAADQLFMSQSGLNQQLLKMEKELGAPLFTRDTHHLEITEAGNIAVQTAKEAIFLEERMQAQIQDSIDGTTGEIRLNLAMDTGTVLFCNVFPVFHQKYPKVRFHLEEQKVYDQYEMLLSKKLDIGMVWISKREIPEFEYVRLAKERFLLGVPRSHPLAQFYRPTEDGDYPEMDLSLCKDEPFSLMFAGSTMRQVIDPLFEEAGFVPQIMFECRMNMVSGIMLQNGICFTILPESQAVQYRRNVCWFKLASNPSWEGCLIYHRDNPPRKAARYFIDLAVQEGKKLEVQSTPIW